MSRFYVAASRARHELCFYTENPKELLKWALQSRAQENPLELLRQQVRERMVKEAATSNQQLSRSLVVTSGNRTSSVVEPPVKHSRHSTPERPIKRQSKANVAGLKPLAPVKKRPMPVEAFWAPANAGEAPPHIEPKHWRELVEDSAIHPEIAARNFRSLQYDMVEQSHEAWEYLFYSDKLERSNTGRLTSVTLNRYARIEAGGWWSSAGVDPRSFQSLQVGQKPAQKLWGSFKPNQPREDTEKPGKKIKYEHPLKTELSIFLLDVPDKIADRIYEQAKVNPSESDLASGFWYCAWKHNLPITITEGAKKAASLLSQGHAAIGLPGIYAGYRSKDEQGYQIKPHLHEELAVFATQSREIRFAFDYETKPKTQRNIEIAISRTGRLLENEGAKVSVVSLPGPDKGVDDLIKAQGPLAYERLEREALRLKEWREKNKAQRSVLELPGKSSVEERKAQLKAKFSNQHSTNLQPKSQEQTKDFNPGQLQSPDGTNSRDSSHARGHPTSSEIRGPGVQNQQHGGKHDQFEVGPERLPAKIADYITQLQQPQRAQPQLTDPPLESQSFQFPVLDESKWSAVRDYFVTQRGLSAALLDSLHNQGTIWADNKQNAVFLRIDKEGQVTGAELIDTSNLQDPFNELAVGSKQNESWFRFAQGDGRLTRVVLTDSPIDALSLATLEQAQQKTIYMSVDEVGNVPQEALQSFSDRGGSVEIAFSADATGIEMTQQVHKQLPSANLIQPKYGKDWNEQLLYYYQMWQHYSSESEGSQGAKDEYTIGKLAWQDGHSVKDIAQMLMRSPAVEQIANQLGANEARNYVGRTTEAVFEVEHRQERHQTHLRNAGLQL